MKKLLLLSASCFLQWQVQAQTPDPRIPVFEVFTSSTCGPCNPGNTVYENVVSGQPANDYVSVKYQQNFPGNGDPYCTAETQSRRSSYYAITSIPRMEIDGGWNKNAQSFTTAIYNSSKAVAPQYNLSGAFTLSGKTITARVLHTPLTSTAAAAGAKLYVVIVETATANNKKSNGETQFHNVVKKMLPNQLGTTLAAKNVGKTDTTSITYTFNGNYRLPSDGQSANQINHSTEHSVENFANLRVVAWVQGADKTIYQGANLMKVNSLSVDAVSSNISPLNVYPNPANNVANVDFTLDEPGIITASIVDLQGALVARQVITGKPGNNHITINTNELASGYYTVILTDTKNGVSVEKLSVTH